MTYDLMATNIGYQSETASAAPRSLQSFMEEHRTIRDFGSAETGQGLVDDGPAITKMANALGYVVIPSGNFRIIGDLTISVPQYYQAGACLIVDNTSTLTITNRIHSSNQWIFQGAGKVIINIVSTMGEDAKLVTAGWFGVFPTNALVSDVTDRMQRALNSMNAQTREGILQLECGSYHLSKTIYVPRGVEISGRGMRRTIFDISGLDFTVFETTGNACKFTNFQFEFPTGQSGVRTAPYIHVKHNTCEIDSIWLHPTTIGIIIDENWCTIRNLRATYGLDPQALDIADTCVVWARTSGFSIIDVTIIGTTFAPHHIVRVGHDTNISAGNIDNIHTTLPATAVFLDNRNCSISRINISNIIGNPASSTGNQQFDSLTKIVAAGAYQCTYITIHGLVTNGSADSLLHIDASDTSVISNISLGSAVAQGNTGYGIRLINNGTGAIRNINIAGDVDVSGRPIRLETVGNVTLLNIPPSLRGSHFSAPFIENFTLGDDQARIIGDNRTAIFAGVLIIGSSNPSVNGIFSFRAASSSNHVTMIAGAANMATATTPLSGSSGSDGRFTVGIDSSGQLVLENRVGSNLTLSITLMAGY